MKKTILAIAASAFITGTILTSCSTPVEKVEDAQQNVNEANKDLNKANKKYDLRGKQRDRKPRLHPGHRIDAPFSLPQSGCPRGRPPLSAATRFLRAGACRSISSGHSTACEACEIQALEKTVCRAASPVRRCRSWRSACPARPRRRLP